MPGSPSQPSKVTTAAVFSESAKMTHRLVVSVLRLLMMLQLWGGAPDSVISAAPIGKERTVYWNSTNPLFKPTGENVLHVNTQDRITFLCPNNGYEYYKIYWTTNRDQSLACSGGQELFNCRNRDFYLVIVQIFSADPTAPVFLSPVYFYTPSTGDLLGLDRISGGACQTRNMRITLTTDPVASSPEPTTSVSTSTSPFTTPATSVTSSASLGTGRTSEQSTTTQSNGRTDDDEAQTVTTGQKKPEGADAQHPDYSRMSNLITGSAVAMPTVAAVASLTCLSLLLITTEHVT